MKIAICDDTKQDIEIISGIINEYANHHKINIEIVSFSNPFVFLKHLNLLGTKEYDLIILDVVMQQSGIDVAERIRKIDDQIKIVFSSTSKDYALDAFKVRAYDYLLKPVSKTSVFKCLSDILIIHKTNTKTSVSIKSEDFSIMSLEIKDITYIESRDRKMEFNQVDGNKIISTSMRTKFLESIPFNYKQFEFINCHSSFIVNMNYIKAIETNNFVLKDGTIIPISRRLYQQVKDRYIKHLIGE